MIISLKNKEIENALVHYIRSQGIDLAEKTITVTLIAGRGSNGHTANIAIEPAGAATETGEPADNVGINFQQ